MKKISIIIAGLAIFGLTMTGCGTQTGKDTAGTQKDTTVTAAAGSIVFFDLDKVLERYDMATDLRGEVEKKVTVKQQEITRRQKNLENEAKDFQYRYQNGLMTTAAAQKKQEELDRKAAEFQQFAAKEQNEIMEEQQVMMNQLAEAIKVYVDKYNKDKGFAMIIANQANVPVVTGDSTLNITEDIIAGLNTEYSINKNKE